MTKFGGIDFLNQQILWYVSKNEYKLCKLDRDITVTVTFQQICGYSPSPQITVYDKAFYEKGHLHKHKKIHQENHFKWHIILFHW